MYKGKSFVKLFFVIVEMKLADFVLTKNNFIRTFYLKNETGAIKTQPQSKGQMQGATVMTKLQFMSYYSRV